MTSSDNSVKLTNYRIIYDSENDRQQVMLKDFQSYELRKSSFGAYGALLVICIAITVFIINNIVRNYLPGSGEKLFSFLISNNGFIMWMIFIVVVHFFYFVSRRRYVKINGKYNSFEFRVTSFNSSVKKMLNELVRQSNLAKQNFA